VRAVDVLRAVVSQLVHPDAKRLELIVHDVGVNWRQRYETPERRLANLAEGLEHSGPFQGRLVEIDDVVAGSPVPASVSIPAGNAVSITSRVFSRQGRLIGHLPIMNLHPAVPHVDRIVDAVELVVQQRRGYLLASGRYYHYYGHGLLSGSEWLAFLVRFLMATDLVSPRYIGHCLHRDFAALRLLPAPPHKPVEPSYVATVGRPNVA
jgi:hypothetical protein